MNALNNKSQTESSLTSVRGGALDLGSRKFWLEWRPLACLPRSQFSDLLITDCCDSMSEEEERLRVERHVP
jgi:hypothetical protein